MLRLHRKMGKTHLFLTYSFLDIYTKWKKKEFYFVMLPSFDTCKKVVFRKWNSKLLSAYWKGQEIALSKNIYFKNSFVPETL